MRTHGMKSFLLVLLAALAAPFAQAANTTISGLPPAASITGSEQLGMDQGTITVRYSLWKIIGLPQNTQNNNYVFALSDQGDQVYHSDTNAYTYTIPLNSLTAFPIGTQITVVNNANAGVISVTPFAGVTLELSGSSSSGVQNVAAQTVVRILKTGTDQWIMDSGGPGGGGGGSGTVTSTSVVPANGFAGSVGPPPTTPAITPTTTVTGPLKGNSGALQPATAADLYGPFGCTGSATTFLNGA